MQFCRKIQNIMLDLTSYRRKDKFAQSITVMRELFHEYNRVPRIKRPHDDDVDALSKRTISVEKFNDCFKTIAEDSARVSTSDTYPTRTMSKGESRNRFQSPYLKGRRESAVFRSEFSQTCSLFSPHPGVKTLEIVPKENVKPVLKEQPNLFEHKEPVVRNPSNLFIEMKKKKQELEEKSLQKKARMKVIRHNWIVNHLYESKSAQNLLPRYRIKPVTSFEVTKQNIFPCV